VRASLADQDDGQLSCLAAVLAQALQRPDTLAIALGANLPSPAGEPADTLLAVRPLLEQMLQRWAQASLLFRWSPLLQTAPVGGPPGQRLYSNGVLLAELPATLAVTAAMVASAPQGLAGAALDLLQGLQRLEAEFGRPPQAERQHWGPRSLDLDLLWWGELELDLPPTAATPALQLPHPLWRQRSFVLEPLATLIPADSADRLALSLPHQSLRDAHNGSTGTP
jgi:2-amino-4-hydroxy-6-hydroxymethyldihydropteridine diphosphokinase